MWDLVQSYHPNALMSCFCYLMFFLGAVRGHFGTIGVGCFLGFAFGASGQLSTKLESPKMGAQLGLASSLVFTAANNTPFVAMHRMIPRSILNAVGAVYIAINAHQYYDTVMRDDEWA
eukprot:PhM_4_TR4776/c0_g1_i1/m.106511